MGTRRGIPDETAHSPETVRNKAEQSFRRGCFDAMFSDLRHASPKRHEFFAFLANQLGIEEDPKTAPAHQLGNYLFTSPTAPRAVPGAASELLSKLVELAVTELAADHTEEARNFRTRSRDYLRSGFNETLVEFAGLNYDEGSDGDTDRRMRERAMGHIRQQGKFLLVDPSDEDMSMDILRSAMERSLPGGVTIKQLYEALHENAVARFDDGTSRREDRSESFIQELRSRFAASFQPECEE